MSTFYSEKQSAMAEYETALLKNKIDTKVWSILGLLNAHPDYYTTSSCSGRILLLALAQPGTKNDSEIIEKWHDTVLKAQIKKSIDEWKKYPYLFFMVQSPIFHITTHELNAATQLRNLGDSAGFKYSSIRSIKPLKPDKSILRITVELLSTERLNVPIGFESQVFVDDKYLDLLINLANNSILESGEKLKKLEQILRNGLEKELVMKN